MLDQTLARDLYRRLLRIRKVEEKIVELYPRQEMRCPTHLSLGQEAAAAGVCAALRDEDRIFSTHRCHAHYLAKGGDLKRMFAELYGRVTGCAKGKGGSMHLVQPEAGIMGASAIVGGSLPIAVGSALAARMQGRPRVAVAFFGDGAVEEGVFHESLNFAALRKLPVVFVCENNFYATHSHQSARQPADNIHERAAGYAMPGVRADGTDASAVYVAAREAVQRARRGDGPTLLEIRLYRWKEHVGPNYDYAMGYRTREELDAWMERCPVRLFESRVVEGGVLGRADLQRIADEIDREIAEAVAFGRESPEPGLVEMLEDVY
jgi:TPP-dependent pyruvate/acetoin dehydrogenase alpha subunit